MLPGLVEVKQEATFMGKGNWVVRPEGACGMCGFAPVPWTAQYITAPTAEAAVNKARKLYLAVDEEDTIPL